MKKWLMVAALSLTVACSEDGWKTAKGCKIYVSEIMQAHTEACVAAYHTEKARQEGRAVTTCRTVGSTTTCVDG
ncbi:hypothetical protein [Antarctobacter sp.]|uniref:hypothetical protein n=1 Tax=Antarctobacter sp. TaxID=1872577 RepID=UPI002B271305|nr:hypothetical protein [Antarctobacter sp.]